MRILVCVDRSERTQKIVDYASNLARKLQAKMTVLYMVTLPVGREPLLQIDPKPFLDSGNEFLNEIRVRMERSGIEVETHLDTTIGNPAHKIVNFAEEGFDMIVVGAMGERGVKNLLLGSVSATVARSAKCPVLIVR